jgi:arginase family enzyme
VRATGGIIGADIVELNPYRDANHDKNGVGTTAMVAAKLLKEVATRMFETK